MYELRIYKNEYSERQLAYIRKHYTVVNETEKVLSIESTEDEINKIQSAMFRTDEQFKKIFPEYMTKVDRELYTAAKLAELKSHIADTLLDCINNGDTDSEEFASVRSFYLHDLCLIN